MTSRTASVLISEQEVRAIGEGRRVLYRPRSKHWDGQFRKFLEPRQVTLVGFEAQDIVHLSVDTGAVDRETGRPIIKKVESRVLSRITNEAVFPDDYGIEHDGIRPGDPCWFLVLRERVK